MCISTQLCPTLCNPMDSRPPGSSVCGISQARVPEIFAFPLPEYLPNPGLNSCPLWPTKVNMSETTKQNIRVHSTAMWPSLLKELGVGHWSRQGPSSPNELHSVR